MQRIVFAGAGIVGLTGAKLLYDRGIRDITLIDKRLGIPTRPGYLSEAIFDNVGDKVKSSLPHSVSNHIKELQAGLEKTIQRLCPEIKLIKGAVETVDETSITYTVEGETETKAIPYDLSFDGTGESRALIDSLNKTIKPPPFSVEPIAENPHPHHFFAYVIIEDIFEQLTIEKLELTQSGMQRPPKSLDPLRHTLQMEKLRKGYGWSKFSEPQLLVKILKNHKVGLYYEIPATLPSTQYESYLSDLLELYTGDKITFKHPKVSLKGKKRFSPFVVQPTKVTPVFFKFRSDGGFIIPIGDAAHTGDYRLGMNIYRGIEVFEAFLEAVTIKDHKIMDIDFKQYETAANAIHEKHNQRLLEYYEHRRDIAEGFRVTFEASYKEALGLSKDLEQKKIISQGLCELKIDKLTREYSKAREELLNIIEVKSQLERSLIGNYKVKYAKGYQQIKDTLKVVVDSKDVPKEMNSEAKNLLLKVADQFKKIAKELFSVGNFIESAKYYRDAVSLYNEYFLTLRQKEIAESYLGVSSCALTQKNFSEARNSSRMAFIILKKIGRAEEDIPKLMFKTTHHSFLATINILLIHLDKPSLDLDIMNNHYEDALVLLGDLKTGSLDKQKIEQYEGIMGNIRERLNYIKDDHSTLRCFGMSMRSV